VPQERTPSGALPGSGKEDDHKSIASTASSISELKKDFKSMNKAFATVNTQLAQLREADTDISESDGGEEASHFQLDEASQFAQVDKEFEARIAKSFKQTHGSRIKLDLGEVMLLEHQFIEKLLIAVS
jgi:predicted  nucleic acid-binding Zn-ribbon protein